jgi:tetratricopeptide (TPR) repeat protein
VELGLKAFKEDRAYEDSVRLYKIAMDSRPNEDEARAAMYNMGCAYVKLKQWQEATNCIVSAINDYNLKLSVALQVSGIRSS